MTIPTADVGKFLAERREFFEYLHSWLGSLDRVRMADLTNEGGGVRRVCILSVDLIKCFTTTGPLASARVAGVLPQVVKLFHLAYAFGVRDFVLAQDAHPEDSPQFEDYGRHCVAGTPESQTVDELASLPFADLFTIMLKRSLNVAIGTDLDPWFDNRPQVDTTIIVGDCTDLCVYQAATHVKLRANAQGKQHRVIVPADCVQTYDLSVEKAQEIDAVPHDADLLHLIFLYHMALNGICVVAGIDGVK